MCGYGYFNCFLACRHILNVSWKKCAETIGYPASEEVIVPWNARYAFPSQSNKAEKMTPRIPPKNGNAFNPGQVIRLEFPAQGKNPCEFKVTSIP